MGSELTGFADDRQLVTDAAHPYSIYVLCTHRYT